MFDAIQEPFDADRLYCLQNYFSCDYKIHKVQK